MSFIIDVSKHNYFDINGMRRNIIKELKDQKKEKEILKNSSFSLVQSLQNSLKNQQSGYCNYLFSSTINKITLQSLIILQQVNGLVKFYINDINKSITIQIEILNKSSNYLVIDNHEKRNFLNRMINIKGSLFQNYLFKIDFNLNNGKVTLWFPLFYFFEGKQFQSQSNTKRIIILNQLISFINAQMKLLMKFLNQFIFQKKKLEQNKISNSHTIFYKESAKKLLKFYKLSNLYVKNYNGTYNSSYNTMRQQQIKQIQSRKHLMSNIYQVNTNIIKNNDLYLNINSYFDDSKASNKYQLAESDHNIIRDQLFIFQRVKQHPNEEINLLTDIYILNTQKIRLIPINKGGFSQIYQAQIQYVYKNNINNIKKNKITNQIFKDIFIIKKQILKQNRNICKNQHQSEIIQLMRNSTSSMINRYFCPLNEGNLFKNDIIMSRMSLNLSQFISFNTKCLSLHTKLYFFLNIIQCIRSINVYNVVHLDLKPSNLMLNEQLVVKLIDFGQSYHPKLSNLKDYKPGFTFPYSCPQVHLKSNDFTIKNDVYSLGIILYQMIYRKFPFYMNNKPLMIEKYIQKQYMNKWFYDYQQSQTYGQNLVYLILDQLILKCVHQQPSKRPEPIMLALIIYQCMILT